MIFKNHIQVQKKKENFVVACLRPLYNVKLGLLKSWSCSDSIEMYKKNMTHVHSCFAYFTIAFFYVLVAVAVTVGS